MMLSPQMIENEKDFSCSKNHGLPIISILLDQNLSREERFLCVECLSYGGFNGQVQGLMKTIELIKEQQMEKMFLIQQTLSHPIRTIQNLVDYVQELKSKVFEKFEELINLINEWISILKQQEQQHSMFSFHKELEDLINNQGENLQNLGEEIMKINQSYQSKVSTRLEYFLQFSESKYCFQQLDNLKQDTLISHSQLLKQEKIILKNSKIKLKQQVQDGQIGFNQVDNSIEGIAECNAISFNSSGTIMISNEEEKIKVWSFDNGQINQIKTLTGHQDWIYTLTFSKKHNFFISGSGDKTIRCWKYNYEVQNWVSLSSYKEHTDWVMCTLLNSNEDLLFSGGADNSIIIWMVDLNKNELHCSYQLKKHQSKVIALSLNQSENYLVSCAADQNSIILWEKNKKNYYEFKYKVKQSIKAEGLKLQFINDQQFIWVTGGEGFDQVWVFELEGGIFTEKQQKTIQLENNATINDEYFFPINYIPQRNLIIIRHKTFIYLIRKTNNNMFKIVNKQQCGSVSIYGTVTNDGQFLVLYKKVDSQYSYSIFELQNI